MATKYPPQLSIGEAIRVIKEMYITHKSKEVSLDLMQDILNISQKSSYFPKSISTLQKFGLVTRRPHGIIELTDPAMQIIEPIGDEDIETKLNLFRKDDVLSALLDKYPNGVLPSEEQLQQTLMKTFNIPRDTVKRWYQFVIESFRELPKEETNKDNLLQSASPKIKADISLGGNADMKFSRYQNIRLPSGIDFSFHIEDGYDLRDLNFITNFIDLIKKEFEK